MECYVTREYDYFKRLSLFSGFLAAQVKMKDKGFLSKDITVEDLISIKGDVHHIFPKDYLKRVGLVIGRIITK